MKYKDLILATIQNRKIVNKILSQYTTEQLNIIPPGFNNNLIWNAAHIISIQQTLIYRFSGHNTPFSGELVKAYTIDTKPESEVDEDFIEMIKRELKNTIDIMIDDIEADKFLSYTPFVTSIGFEIKDLSSALTFNLYHEGLHLGYIMNIKRFL